MRYPALPCTLITLQYGHVSKIPDIILSDERSALDCLVLIENLTLKFVFEVKFWPLLQSLKKSDGFGPVKIGEVQRPCIIRRRSLQRTLN